MSRTRLLPIRLLGVLAALALAAPAGAHPQDGPDVDVRIEIRDEAVRVALTFNLAFADEIADAPRENLDVLHRVEEPALRDALLDFVRGANRVAIDGVEVSPVLIGFEALEPELSLLPLFPSYGLRALTKVRLVVEYPAKTPPSRVSFVWGEFPVDPVLSAEGDLRTVVVAAQLLARGADTIVEFTDQEPEYVWHAPADGGGPRLLPVPEPPQPRRAELPLISIALGLGWVGLACVIGFTGGGRGRGWTLALATPAVLLAAALTWDRARLDVSSLFEASSLPTEAEALTIFVPLHANIYRAFDYTAELEVYDALARSVDGPLLDSLYNQVYESLIMREEGGAVSRVQSVDPLETSVESIGVLPDGRSAFDVLARWRVTGSVFHWGHSHTRTNEYRARYTVIGGDEGWRIAGTEVLEQFRVDAAGAAPMDEAIPEEL